LLDQSGVCIFGDNAYINTKYLATPFANVSSGSRDAYNFYHSQLRIRVECAFGMLTQQWGILRSPIPKNIPLSKVPSLVLALAKLHNFCIEKNEEVTTSTATDESFIQRNEAGYVPLVQVEHTHGIAIPTDLLNGGHHSNDYDRRNFNRQRSRGCLATAATTTTLPREILHEQVAVANLTRPYNRSCQEM